MIVLHVIRNRMPKKAADAYVDLARLHDLDPSAMALAFVNQQQFVSANIIGATTMAQLKVNISSADLVLSHDVLAGIEAIHQQYSNPAP